MKIIIAIALFLGINSIGTYKVGDLVGERYDPVKVEQYKKEGHTVVLYFTAESWCPTCRVVAQTVFKDRKIINHIKENSKFLVVDLENNDPELWAVGRPYGVYGVPTMVILYPNGGYKTLTVPSKRDILRHVK